jgi:tetratricopeptide (TPR) repeat protein
VGQSNQSVNGISSSKQATATMPQMTKSSAGRAAKEQKAISLINQGKLKEAEKIYGDLIATGTRNHIIYGNLAAVCGMQGNFNKTTDLLEKAIELKPDFPEHHYNLGIAVQKKGDLNAAIISYNKAIELKPEYTDAHYNLGNAHHELGELTSALNSYKVALQLNHKQAKAHNNIGNIYHEIGDIQSAIISYRNALEINPNYVNAIYNLGNSLKDNGDFKEAIICYNKALELAPNYVDAINNLGNALKDNGDLKEAIACFKKVLNKTPTYPEAYNNLGNTLEKQGEFKAAIIAYNKAIELKPTYPDAQKNLSMAELLTGDYQSGWLRYEYRFKCKKNNDILSAAPPCKQWNGEKLSQDTRLIVISEQGLGDTLQFMRYARALRNLGYNVSLCTPPRLHPLIQTSGIDPFPITPEQANQMNHGRWVPLLSVARHLQISPSNPIISTNYIKPSSEKFNKWQDILSGNGNPTIGINWRGNRKNSDAKERNIPIYDFKEILKSIKANFLVLQRDAQQSEIKQLTLNQKLTGQQQEILRIADSDEPEELLEYTAIIANCDLVITTGTTVAHLAAGTGIPTWTLLPKSPSWRWGIEGDTTFWYSSMRLFRQQQEGNWDEVIQRVTESLQKQFCTDT